LQSFEQIQPAMEDLKKVTAATQRGRYAESTTILAS